MIIHTFSEIYSAHYDGYVYLNSASDYIDFHELWEDTKYNVYVITTPNFHKLHIIAFNCRKSIRNQIKSEIFIRNQYIVF